MKNVCFSVGIVFCCFCLLSNQSLLYGMSSKDFRKIEKIPTLNLSNARNIIEGRDEPSHRKRWKVEKKGEIFIFSLFNDLCRRRLHKKKSPMLLYGMSSKGFRKIEKIPTLNLSNARNIIEGRDQPSHSKRWKAQKKGEIFLFNICVDLYRRRLHKKSS